MDRKIYLMDKYQHTGDEKALDEALQLYHQELEHDPNNPKLLFFYGWLQLSKGTELLHKASACFSKGLESDNLQPNSWIDTKLNYNFIQVHAHLLQNIKSVQFYKQRLSQRPDDPQVYCYLCHCYMQADQVEEASKVAEAGVKVSSTHGPLVYLQGVLSARQGNTEQALQYWQRAIELDSELVDARINRASVLEREKRFAESVEEWKQVITWFRSRGHLSDGPEAELKRVEEKMRSNE